MECLDETRTDSSDITRIHPSSPQAHNSSAHSIGGHNSFLLANDITFTSNFDSGNLANAIESSNPYEYQIWSAPDNMNSQVASKQSIYYHFCITGNLSNITLKFKIMNNGIYNHILYRQDIKPVYKSIQSNNKYCKIKKSIRVNISDEEKYAYFEHTTIENENKIYFAFTYPYSYSDLQTDLSNYEAYYYSSNHFDAFTKSSIYYHRELLTLSPEGRRIDLVTITSNTGKSSSTEPPISGLFPDSASRCSSFPHKEVLFVSARVHPGEIPSSLTLKGIFDFLVDETDVRAAELRSKYVVKIVPMINPDGVYRGHFRYDQFGDNLNRFYVSADPVQQPAVFAIAKLLDHYAKTRQLALYLDLHAHANKKGCFIYGNVLDSIAAQVQNQLYCRLIALNSSYFDYNSCLFSKKHMYRMDPGDVRKGLTAEGSGRVSTYLQHNLIHSYTLECNYNSGGSYSDVITIEGKGITTQPFLSSFDKYTPETFADVGRACMVAWLDIRAHNPVSRLGKSRFRTLERLRAIIIPEVKIKQEFRDHSEIERDGRMNVWRRCVPSFTPMMESDGNPIKTKIKTNVSADSYFEPCLSSMVKLPSAPSRSVAFNYLSKSTDIKSKKNMKSASPVYPQLNSRQSGGRVVRTPLLGASVAKKSLLNRTALEEMKDALS